jgi:hypothetical protein
MLYRWLLNLDPMFSPLGFGFAYPLDTLDPALYIDTAPVIHHSHVDI